MNTFIRYDYYILWVYTGMNTFIRYDYYILWVYTGMNTFIRYDYYILWVYTGMNTFINIYTIVDLFWMNGFLREMLHRRWSLKCEM
jgi:hypothetical protein